MNSPGGIVAELVHQFTDPFAFYRELIQNSIDAGSTRIEVSLSYRAASKATGLMLASVSDWGEGMTRDVIENYLVTKFRSTKENDLTKIGKFGIGFVSIFSCKPDAVTVDTGRDGDFWRVLFRADTTWELLKLAEPLEGTRVTLHKQMTSAEYDEFARRSRQSVARWCKHSDVDVTFAAGGADGSAPTQAEPVREPLVVDAPFQVEHVEEGTHIVLGPARAEKPVTGMYNRGLTLLETEEPLVPGVAMKIVSRYLEHTLTRDNVRRDQHFAHALSLARKLVERALLPRLPAELQAAAEKKDGRADFDVLFRFAAAQLKPRQLRYRLAGGGAVTHDALEAHVGRAGRLVCSERRTPLVERLLDAGWPVLEGTASDPAVASFVQREGVRHLVTADDAFTYAAPPETPTPPEFARTLSKLLVDAGAQLEHLELSAVRGALSDEPFVLLEALSRCVAKEDALRSPFSRGAPGVLCFNASHPAVRKAAGLFTTAPRLAAFLMARLVLVSESRLTEAREAALTRWALA